MMHGHTYIKFLYWVYLNIITKSNLSDHTETNSYLWLHVQLVK